MALFGLLAGVSWISIALFVVGMGFLIWEMFEPGFGFFGIFGIVSFAVCIFVTAKTVAEGIIMTVFFVVILLIMLGIFLVLVSKGKLPGKLILQDSEKKEAGYAGTKDFETYIGKTGTVTTVCRPVGSADFDGKKLEVVSRGEFLDKGEVVEVVEAEGNRVVVRPAKNP